MSSGDRPEGQDRRHDLLTLVCVLLLLVVVSIFAVWANRRRAEDIANLEANHKRLLERDHRRAKEHAEMMETLHHIEEALAK